MLSALTPSFPVRAGLLMLPVVGFLLALVQPKVAQAWDSGAFSSTAERTLIALTEDTREAAGVDPLNVDAALSSVARWRSRDMVERGYFSHDIPDVGNVFRRLDANGYCYELAGENVGWDTDSDAAAPGAIHEMFLASPGHLRTILEGRWEAIGVGAYKASDGRKMWTVLFADRCG